MSTGELLLLVGMVGGFVLNVAAIAYQSGAITTLTKTLGDEVKNLRVARHDTDGTVQRHEGQIREMGKQIDRHDGRITELEKVTR